MMHRIVEKIHEFSLRYERTMHRNFQHVTKFSLRYDKANDTQKQKKHPFISISQPSVVFLKI